MRPPTLSLSLSLLLLSLLFGPWSSQPQTAEASFFGRRSYDGVTSLTDRESSHCGSHHMPCPAAEPCCNSKNPKLRERGFFLEAHSRAALLIIFFTASLCHRRNVSYHIHGGMSNLAWVRSTSFTPGWLLPLARLPLIERPVQKRQPPHPQTRLHW
jgi:hypothetical protein